MSLNLQEKLKQIKAEEANVTALQKHLEHLHETIARGSIALKRADRCFEEFTYRWSNIVEKISAALEKLSNYVCMIIDVI